MTYDDLLTIEPTLSENVSRGMFHEILQQGWRAYSSEELGQEETQQLVDRFLRAHARIPGLITEKMMATMPIDSFRYTTEEGARILGSLFLNGAVVTVFPPNIGSTLILFVNDATAEQWKYPEDGYHHIRIEDGTE